MLVSRSAGVPECLTECLLENGDLDGCPRVPTAARELLATFTARAPHGSVLVESVLIGPEDVKIVSVESQEKMLHELFGVELSEAPEKKAAPRPKVKSN